MPSGKQQRHSASPMVDLPWYTSIALAFLGTVFSAVSQLSLSPSHGSIPASSYHSWLITVVFILNSSDVFSFPSRPWIDAKFLPLIIAWNPLISLWLTPVARYISPEYSALLIEVITVVPYLDATFSILKEKLKWLVPVRVGSFLASLVPIVMAIAFYRLLEAIVHPVLQALSGLHTLLSYNILFVFVTLSTCILLPSRMLIFALIPLLHTLNLNPHTQLGWPTSRLNATLQGQGFSLLARQESFTGYLSVLENRNDGYRVMRCDHSLLGGEWVYGIGSWPGGKGYDGPTGVIGEPVYSVFIMLEAVRLVQSEGEETEGTVNSTDDEKTQSAAHESRALVMWVEISASTKS